MFLIQTGKVSAMAFYGQPATMQYATVSRYTDIRDAVKFCNKISKYSVVIQESTGRTVYRNSENNTPISEIIERTQ